MKILTHLTQISVVCIPVYLIWTIQTRWTQKIALTCSLCLTSVMIIVTIIRVSGIQYHGKINAAWEILWQILAAEISLILTAVSSFRALFVVRAKERNRRSYDEPRPLSWWNDGGRFRGVLLPRSWYRRLSRRPYESDDGSRP